MALFSPNDLPLWLQGGLLGPIVSSLPQQQQQPAASPDILSMLGSGISNNPMTLMSLGAGIMRGGLGQGLQSAMMGSQLDQRNRQTQQSQMATFAALKARGLSDADAMAAIRNPEMLKALLPSAVPEYKPVSNGQLFGNFNPATGATRMTGASPTFQTMTPGQVGGYATPDVPGGDPTMSIPQSQVNAANAPIVPTAVPTTRPQMPGGIFTPVATGGPEKPPSGYEYVDAMDPTKGLRPIAGGPATVMPGDVAGRAAMIEAARPALVEAKKYFTDPRGIVNGPVSFVGQAIGQRTHSFEIGRQQRNIRVNIETALRVATGAAAPASEVASYEDMFMPKVTDTLATRVQKIEALQRFITFAERNMVAGRMPPPSSFMNPGSDKSQDRVPAPPPGFVRQ